MSRNTKLKTSSGYELVPVKGEALHYEIEATNASLLHILKKQSRGTVSSFKIPVKDGDIFERKIMAIKFDSIIVGIKEAGAIPDLEDVYYTDLPWHGTTTFKQSSPQFRSRNVLGVFLELIKQYDDFLYRFTDFIPNKISGMHDNSNQPTVYILTNHGKKSNCRRIYRSTRTLKPTDRPAKLPQSLINDMVEAGYTYNEISSNKDKHQFEEINEKTGEIISVIIVEFHGQLIREDRLGAVCKKSSTHSPSMAVV